VQVIIALMPGYGWGVQRMVEADERVQTVNGL
jgi:hypothetical protein